MPRITAPSLVRKPDDDDHPPSTEALLQRVRSAVDDAVAFVHERASEQGPVAFMSVERELVQLVLAVGRALVVLFLALREKQVAHDGRVEGLSGTFRPAPPIARNLTTWFGTVRYWRQYMREEGEVRGRRRRGFHPLDRALGLLSDRLSFNVLSVAVRLATKLSFAEARTTMMMFIPQAPSTEVIEQSALGFGRHTADWFEEAPPPDRDGPDGEVLVVMADGKGAPTATETELKRRRGKRRKKKLPTSSKRHRGRERRRRHPKKPRRKKGDKSKNARMATLVLMYTLRREGDRLVGPLNVWTYASFAPKAHAFGIAAREARKRGFAPEDCEPGSGKLVQFLSDGDNDLERLASTYLPHARQTIDCMHVVERLWTVGACFFAEGSAELKAWVEAQKTRLYRGRAYLVVRELRERLERVPRTGPGNKGRRERLEDNASYIEKRLERMNYHELLALDLEISTGPIEGAVKNVIGKRCDHGGMRWIRERVEVVVQLRCIELNGDWDRFVEFVHRRLWAESLVDHARQRLQRSTPAPLPDLQEAA
jgi:hypothetical protein